MGKNESITDISKLRRLHDCSLYMQGARNALLNVRDIIMPYIKGDNYVYADAEFKLFIEDMRNTEEFMKGARKFSYRGHIRKGKKLVKCEAYFI